MVSFIRVICILKALDEFEIIDDPGYYQVLNADETEEVLNIIKMASGQLIWQNGYVFEFCLKGRYYSVTNQGNRISGGSWSDAEWNKILRARRSLKYEFSHWCYYGNGFERIDIEALAPAAFALLVKGEFQYPPPPETRQALRTPCVEKKTDSQRTGPASPTFDLFCQH